MSEKCPYCEETLPENDDLAIAHFEAKHTSDVGMPTQAEIDEAEDLKDEVA